LLYRELGRTGLTVSALCFGSLSIGPAQYDLPPERAGAVLKAAWDLGVNFFDTAEIYGTYPHLRAVANLPGAVISSRSFAATEEGMRASLGLARRQLGRDVLDIFGLHEQESGLTLKGHREALEFLASQREKGRLKAVAVSTHAVPCVRAAAMLDEVDAVFALLNVEGLGIRGGGRQDMEEALAFAKEMGKGVYLMKVLGGGHLYRDPARALRYAREFPHKDSVCVGMRDGYEVEFAARVLCGEDAGGDLSGPPDRVERRLLVEGWCTGCGECVKTCPFEALRVEEGRAQVERGKCMLCGYCARVCPHFCLKVV
jgi:aryl-alcohol dehydrogenase-like predicted oxidoreductase